eukprot:TRINITY_DN11068_c0_g1_i4.p2 TRINITY_DN11068_c0_g1~~TRINITY_DN11068_c0_g1_i4.p2  ORF type:complete len:427 (+),score=50.86 TRINITY_DN11068_c0_g1_i4:31-1311(+)
MAALECGSFIHPWQPESCTIAVAELAMATAKASLPLYGTLQAISASLKLPACKSKADLKRLIVKAIKASLRSSAFITSLASALVAAICALRNLLGRHYASTTGAIPAAIASLTLLIENSHRRRDLAVYVATQAVRILATKLVASNVVPTLPYYEVVLMSVSMGVVQRLRQSGLSKGLIATMMTVFVPNDERSADNVYTWLPKAMGQYFQKQTEKLYATMDRLGLTTSCARCSHRGSCVCTVLAGMGHGFLMATLIKSTTTIIGLLRKRGTSSPSRGSSSSSLYLLCMLLPGLVRGARCGARRWLPNMPELDVHTFAGVASGLAFVYNRSAGLSSYAIGKSLDLYVDALIANGSLSPVPGAPIGLFAAAAAVIVHFAIFDEQQLPSSYRRFLNDVTGGMHPVWSSMLPMMTSKDHILLLRLPFMLSA